MTKKHFEQFAKSVHNLLTLKTSDGRVYIDVAARHMAEAFANIAEQTNDYELAASLANFDNFDKQRFFQDCGLR